MPKIPKTKGPLPVQVRIWRGGGKDRKPRTEYLANGTMWMPCKNLAAARAYAREHGYAGIRVTPI